MDHRDTVRRFVEDAVNGGHDEVIDEVFAPELTGWVREWFGAFRDSFPDMQMELLDLVSEGNTVVGRFACSATHLGEWRGHPPTGRRFERVDEVTSSRSTATGSRPCGASRTRSTASSSSGCRRAAE